MSADFKARTQAMFESARSDWETPRAFFAALDAEFGFDLDVCATASTAKCRRYYSPEDDALSQRWTGVCWMNPPYGRGVGEWIRKAYLSSLEGATVVCLVPARTDTAWWHEYCMRGEIRFVRGRLRFGGCRHNAPFPCAVVVFGPDAERRRSFGAQRGRLAGCSMRATQFEKSSG